VSKVAPVKQNREVILLEKRLLHIEALMYGYPKVVIDETVELP
jgi:hypothetical protein